MLMNRTQEEIIGLLAMLGFVSALINNYFSLMVRGKYVY